MAAGGEHGDAEADADRVEPRADDGAGVDQLGIPMSREPTLDDVRTDGDDHRRLAIGCAVLVTLALVAFWLVRGMLLR